MATTQETETTQESTTQEESIGSGLGMKDFLHKHKANSEDQAKEGSKAQEGDSTTKSQDASEKQPSGGGEEGKDGKEKEQYLKDDPFVNELRKDNQKYRQKLREHRARFQALEEEIRQMKAKQEGGQEEYQGEIDEQTKQLQREYDAKVKVSRQGAVKRLGEEKFFEMFTDDDAPWKEMERKAVEGDPLAYVLNQRVRVADDPYLVAEEILQEEALYEQYGTRNLQELVEKVKDSTLKDNAKNLNNRLNEGRKGKPVQTLGKTRGESEQSVGTERSQAAYRPFADMEMFKHLS